MKRTLKLSSARENSWLLLITLTPLVTNGISFFFFRYGIEGWGFLPKTGAARSKRTPVIPPPQHTRRARRRPVLGGMVVRKGDALPEDSLEFEVEKGR